MNTKELDNQYVASTYARFPICIVSGKGALAYDENGKEYIDLGTGIAVNTFGYSDTEWVKAVEAQLETLQHTSNLYYSEPCAKLAEMLCNRTGMNKVFFSNSGAEANECAIKVARKYGGIKKGAEYTTIITLKDSFHGRTITTLAATGQDVFHKDFLPLTNGFVYAEKNNIDNVKQLLNENKCCAIMFEVVQGEGGVNILSADYLKAVEALCHDRDILLIVDEVQTGIGRCGKFFGYMNAGITPDIVTTAKGLGGGLPIGTFIAGEKCAKTLGASMHGSTFGANPVSCAAACNVVSRITDDFLAEVNAKGAYIREKIAALGSNKVKEVRGIGMMTGIAVTVSPKDVLHDAFDNGLLVLTAGSDVVRLLPPLTISYEEIDRGIEILAKVL